MQRFALFTVAVCLMPLGASAQVSSLSYYGTLPSAQNVASFTFTLSAADTITFQTWGFGGGVNAAGTLVLAGGFDPLIALYAGGMASAPISVDGSGNPLADAGNLLDGPWSDVDNCPTAGTVQIGSNSDCADVKMSVALAAGTYTLMLTDANYEPAALYDSGGLSEPFIDLTAGGIFQTCDPVANACIQRNGNYAVDIVGTKRDLAAVSKCDINQDLSTNAADVKSMLKQALGVNTPTNDLNADGIVNVVDLETVIDAVHSGVCLAQ